MGAPNAATQKGNGQPNTLISVRSGAKKAGTNVTRNQIASNPAISQRFLRQ